jgi:hypothetical protein
METVTDTLEIHSPFPVLSSILLFLRQKDTL